MGGGGFLSLSPLPALLALGVLFINGWTDAPNAISTAVATGALPYGRAVLLAAGCNLLGCLLTSACSGAVAATVSSLVDLGSDPVLARAALCAALLAVILWGTLAWRFALPTSESHALLAALSGAAVSLRGNVSCLMAEPWRRTFLGLALSLLSGWILSRVLSALLPKRGQYRALQTAAACFMAFAHGAQDGQKFLGVLLLTAGDSPALSALPPIALPLLCALTMALGTALGGRRLLAALGEDLTALTPRSGFAADLSGAICLLFSTLLGSPVSTTHTKAAAILGAAPWGQHWNRPAAFRLLRVWLLTFPACALLAFFLTRIMCC